MTQLYLNIDTNLSELISLLDNYGERDWSNHFRYFLDLLRNGDQQAIVKLTQINQGMGSFNDLTICKINGHLIERSEENYVNTKLNRLFASIISDAQKIRTAK